MDLLARHHAGGRRFDALELIEHGRRVAVRLAVADRGWPEPVEVFKIFTVADDADELVLLEDCVDREDALAKLG